MPQFTKREYLLVVVIIILVGSFFLYEGCNNPTKNQLQKDKDLLIDSLAKVEKQKDAIKSDLAEAKQDASKATENYKAVLNSLSRLENGLIKLRNENRIKVADVRVLGDSATETLYRSNLAKYSNL